MTGASDREKPRKAPVQARSRATYEAILEAAARILEAEGLAGVTTNRVAERAGVSIGSLYQYFPAREAILAELVKRMRLEMSARLIAVSELGGQRSIDLAPLMRPHCELLRRVWRHSKHVWIGTQSLVRGPPLGHRCSELSAP